jgi:glycosyltransferase involved in cell wall biosynthesis
MMQQVRVSLVMPVRNEEPSVERTMGSVFASTRLPDEILIADGLSTDRTVEKITAYAGKGIPLTVIANPTRFSGGGRNLGIRQASGDVILLADFGNVLDPQWIEEMVRPFEEDSAVEMVTGLHRPFVQSNFEHCMAAIHYHINCMLDRYTHEERIQLTPEIVLPGGASLGFRRRVWELVGGYPEWLPKAQDKMFSRKCYALGVPVRISWNAFVSHHMRSAPREVFWQMVAYGRGNGRIGCVDSQVYKLMAVYGLVVGLFAASVVWWPFSLLALGLLLAYFYRAGLRKILKVDGGLKRMSYLWWTPLVLIPRDLGLLVGHFWGRGEWLCVPKYRRLLTAYTAGCDPERLRATSR